MLAALEDIHLRVYFTCRNDGNGREDKIINPININDLTTYHMVMFMIPSTCLSTSAEIRTLVKGEKRGSLVINQWISLPFREMIKECNDA